MSATSSALLLSADRVEVSPAIAADALNVVVEIDTDIVERFRALGPGWEDRMADVLRAAEL